MVESPIDEDQGGADYIPSGRVNAFALVPLSLAGAVLATIMAFFLVLTERQLYVPLITPLLMGLPVIASAWVIVRMSRCRNRWLAGLVGMTLIFAYDASYWQLSYRLNVLRHGPRMEAFVRQVGGLSGVPGYVVFRCRVGRPVDILRRRLLPRRPPRPIQVLFNGLVLAVESMALVLAGLLAGWSAASRAFSERHRRWLSTFEFRLPSATARTVLKAIDAGDWRTLGEQPRISAGNPANSNSLHVCIEYLPGVVGEPGYISLAGRIGRGSAAHHVKQRRIPAAELAALARVLPDLKVPLDEGRPAPAARSAADSPLEDSLRRLGLAAGAGPDPSLDPGGAEVVESDFRSAAVAVSRELVAELCPRSLRVVPASLCLPADPDGRRLLRSASWRSTILQAILLAGTLGCLLLAILGLRMKDGRGNANELGKQLAIAGVIGMMGCGLPSLVLLLGGERVWKPFLLHRLQGRHDSLLDEGHDLASRVLRVEDAHTYHRQKFCGEDLGIALLDPENRRILFEGLSHRYVIRGEDVVSFWPLQTHQILSIRIEYLIDDVTLALVFSTRNPWYHLFWGFYHHREVHRLVRGLAEALHCQPREASSEVG